MARKKKTRKDINAILDMTEEELDVRAEEYESDAWDASRLGKVVMGRPSIADEEVRPVTVRLPISKIAAIDRMAARNETTRSPASVRLSASRSSAASGIPSLS